MKRLLVTIAVYFCMFFYAHAQPQFELSQNVYRLPYANNIKMRINRDHYTHSPAQGRYDLKGFDNGGDCEENYPIAAAAEGVIRRLVDNHGTHGPDCTSNCTDYNNYVWIEHANGEWTKYTHFKKNSVSVNAGLQVGDTVCAGTFLGYECDIGFASGPHLHFEVRHPNDPANVDISTAGGFMEDAAHLIPVINSITKHYMESEDEWTSSGSTSCTHSAILQATPLTISNGGIRIFMATNTIATQANVSVQYSAGANGLFQAGNSVTLTPGFTAQQGSYFHARIGNCAATNFLGACQ